MITREQLLAYHKKLYIEAAIKSVIMGLALGFLAAGGFALLVGIFPQVEGPWLLWVSLGLWIAVAIGTGVPLFLKFYRPTLKHTAARLDKTGGGLSERIITMLELENDDSFIAQKQREDAQGQIKKITPRMMEFKIPLFHIVACAAAAVFAITFVTGMNMLSIDRQYRHEVQALPPTRPPVSREQEIEERINRLLELVDKYRENELVSRTLLSDVERVIEDMRRDVRKTSSYADQLAIINMAEARIRKLFADEMERIRLLIEQLKAEMLRDLTELRELNSQLVEITPSKTQNMETKIDQFINIVINGAYVRETWERQWEGLQGAFPTIDFEAQQKGIYDYQVTRMAEILDMLRLQLTLLEEAGDAGGATAEADNAFAEEMDGPPGGALAPGTDPAEEYYEDPSDNQGDGGPMNPLPPPDSYDLPGSNTWKNGKDKIADDYDEWRGDFENNPYAEGTLEWKVWNDYFNSLKPVG